MNPSRRRVGPRLVAWAVLGGLFALGSRASAIDPADAGKKTPAEWVAQLDAGHLADRDAASAALLVLGAKAREAVRAALDSKDAETQSRAQDLWKTLRWDVIPGAEKETATLVADSESEKEKEGANGGKNDDGGGEADDTYGDWHYFVKNHGAESLRLIAELRNTGFPARFYRAGITFLLEGFPPSDTAGIILDAGPPADKASLEAPLDDISPAKAEAATAAALVVVRTALGEYDKAYEFGSAVAFRTDQDGSEDLISACAVPVRRGDMLEKMDADGLKDVAAETDPDKLCVKLAFYAGIMGKLHKKGRIDPLCDAAIGANLVAANEGSLKLLVKTLLDAGAPGRAAKILHDAKSPVFFYMRSYVDARLKDASASDADWSQAQAATDAMTDAEKKKDTYYEIGELMQQWDDPRAEDLWEKLLVMPPVKFDNDANVCFRLGELLRTKKQYARAADLLEQGMKLSMNSGILSVTDTDGWVSPDGEAAMRDEIKNLRAQAADGKSVSPTPAPAGDATPAPPDAAKTPSP